MYKITTIYLSFFLSPSILNLFCFNSGSSFKCLQIHLKGIGNGFVTCYLFYLTSNKSVMTR